jgi:O-Antigen ligase
VHEGEYPRTGRTRRLIRNRRCLHPYRSIPEGRPREYGRGIAGCAETCLSGLGRASARPRGESHVWRADSTSYTPIDKTSKGFAYLPAKPVFVSEIVLSLGVLAALLGAKLRLAFRSPLAWLLLAFAADGALRTVPYVGSYGMDALRDATIWGYGAFAILMAAFVLQLGCFGDVLDHYRRWLPWLMLWLPLGCVVTSFAADSLPVVSRAPLAHIPYLKPGDVAVQLAGGGCFMALGLHRLRGNPGERGMSAAMEVICWASWLAAAAFTAAQNRGGMLAIFLASALAFALRPLGNWAKPLAMAAIFIAVLFVSNMSIPTPRGRDFSFDQLKLNIESIAGNDATTADLSSTRRWRLQWWDKIVGYTFSGSYFWVGKGFGINIAYSDGFIQSPDDPLRSPHDATATILARMGVPGVVLWGLLHAAFAAGLLRAYVRARYRRDEWWARVDLWILSFWLAFMVNGNFDVFLEGPQGGIWFWSLFGVGIAALELQKQVILPGVTSEPFAAVPGL